MLEYYNYSNSKIQNGLEKDIDSMKIYSYNQDNSIFDYLNFNDDEIFKEPLLISSFFNEKIKKEAFSIKTIMWGYSNGKTEIENLQLDLDTEGVGYIPNLGYFFTNNPNSKCILNFSEQGMRIFEKNNRELSFTFSPIQKIVNKKIELYQAIPNLLINQFKNFEGKICLTSHIDIGINNKNNIVIIEKAFRNIEKFLPEYFKQIMMVAKGIILFESNDLVSFATRVSPGIAYLNVRKNESLIFFIVEIVHQFGHNILYKILKHESNFFLIKSTTPLKELNGNLKEKRSLYSAFHGFYTTTLVAKILDLLIENIDDFSFEEKIEIIGRFVDNEKRYKTGLENISLKKVFTQDGLQLYNILNNVCQLIFEKYEKILQRYDVEDQKFVYNQETFKKRNIFFEKDNFLRKYIYI
jgi:hypothetical protein